MTCKGEGERNGKGGGKRRHHDGWEELDELEYVAGDDENYVSKERVGTVDGV